MKIRNHRRIMTYTFATLICILPLAAQNYQQNTVQQSTPASVDDRSSTLVDDRRSLPHFGIKAGVNISNIYDTESEDLSDTYKAGLAGGLFFSLPLGPVLGIQPEVMYSKKGYNGKGTISAASYKYTRTFDYLDVPIQLQIKPSETVTILAGPVFSWLLNKRYSFKDGTISVDDQNSLEENNIRKNTFGVTGGLDFNLYPVVLSGRLGFDLRDNNGDGTSTDPRFKNAWIQATVGVIF